MWVVPCSPCPKPGLVRAHILFTASPWLVLSPPALSLPPSSGLSFILSLPQANFLKMRVSAWPRVLKLYQECSILFWVSSRLLHRHKALFPSVVCSSFSTCISCRNFWCFLTYSHTEHSSSLHSEPRCYYVCCFLCSKMSFYSFSTWQFLPIERFTLLKIFSGVCCSVNRYVAIATAWVLIFL